MKRTVSSPQTRVEFRGIGRPKQGTSAQLRRQLLLKSQLLEGDLPTPVRQYFLDDALSTDTAAVAQWSVDNEEPGVLKVLCSAGFNGPIRFSDVASEHILPFLSDMPKTPRGPLLLDIEFIHAVPPHTVPGLIRLLQANGTEIRTLRLNLSGQLSQDEATDLCQAVGARAPDVRTLSIKVEGREEGPIPDAVLRALASSGQLLRKMKSKAMRLLLRYPEKLRLQAERVTKLFEFSNGVFNDHALWEKPAVDESLGRSLSEQAGALGEYGVLLALQTLELVPTPGRLSFVDVLPEAHHQDLAKKVGLPVEWVIPLRTSESIRTFCANLNQYPMELAYMEMSLFGSRDETDLHELVDCLLRQALLLESVRLTLMESFRINHCDLAQKQSTEPSALKRLSLAYWPEKKTSHEAAILMTHWLKPQSLYLDAHDMKAVEHWWRAFQGIQDFLWPTSVEFALSTLGMERTASIDAIETFLKEVQGVEALVVAVAGKKTEQALAEEAEDRLKAAVWKHQRLTLLQLTLPGAFFEYRLPLDLRWREQVFQPTFRGKGAETFFPTHLHPMIPEDISRHCIKVGELSPGDQLALSLVSTSTSRAAERARRAKQVDEFSKAMMNRWLDAATLSRGLKTASWSLELDQPLVEALKQHFEQWPKDALAREDKDGRDALEEAWQWSRDLLKKALE